MSNITINGNTYSDDGTSAKDMLNGGHRTHFLPMVGDVATVAGEVQTQATQAAIDAANIAAAAAAVRGTSTTSLAVSAGSKSITTQSGKQFTPGNYVTVSRTSSPTTLMHGVVTAYSGTALTVDVANIAGSGTYADWTIALSGAPGTQGASGNGVMPYAAKTSAYTVVTTDRGSLIDCTSGTFTLSFQSCATLGADWSCYIRNSGSGVITLDPNGSETIDGAASYALTPGLVAQVQCDGLALRMVVISQVSGGLLAATLPIFSAASLAKTPLSSMEVIENSLPSTGLSSVVRGIAYATGQFVVANSTASGSVATSPDGVTWTLRTMPSSAVWMSCVDGANCVAIVPSATTVARSTNSGVTWASGGALPGNPNAVSAYVAPAFTGGICMVPSTTAATAYRSTDSGTSWTTQTLPANLGGNMGIYAVGGLFWYWSSATTAHTSATGLTGSWTARTLPITPGSQYHIKDFDGALLITAAAAGDVYRSADGINWVMQQGTEATFGGLINGIGVYSGVNTYTYHSKRATRSTELARISISMSHQRAMNTAGTVFVCQCGTVGKIARIEPAASDAAVGIFSL